MKNLLELVGLGASCCLLFVVVYIKWILSFCAIFCGVMTVAFNSVGCAIATLLSIALFFIYEFFKKKT